jgi:membrane protein DedA with SNARE-associated domain
LLGYPGIVVLMALESSLLPVPSEIVMPFAGYLASQGRFHLVLAALAGAAGCNIGSTLIYYIGAIGGRALIDRHGHYLFLTKAKVDRVERYFRRWGGITIFLVRMMPLLPVVVSLPAGFARMPLWKFQLYTFAGCFLWCLALAALGYEFGLAWQSHPWVKAAIHWFNIAVVAAIVLGATWIVWRWRLRKKESSAAS